MWHEVLYKREVELLCDVWFEIIEIIFTSGQAVNNHGSWCLEAVFLVGADVFKKRPRLPEFFKNLHYSDLLSVFLNWARKSSLYCEYSWDCECF